MGLVFAPCVAVNNASDTPSPRISAMRPLLAAVVLALLSQSSPAAAPPRKRPDPKKADKAIREVAGSAEYLRSVPKKFATLQAVDAARRRVTLLADGEKKAREWPLTDD